VVLLVARVAAAQPSQDVVREFQAGVDAFRLGKYDDARVHLEKARTLDPKLPGPHRFLAAVAQAQNKPDECIAEARAAIVANPTSKEIIETRKLHEACRVAAGRAPLRDELGDQGAIAVTANVPGATVIVAGTDYGGTPIEPRSVKPGKIDVVIEKEGWKTQHVTAEVVAGIATDIAVELEPDFSVDARPNEPVKPRTHKGVLAVGGVGDVSVDGKRLADARRIELEEGVHVVEIRGDGVDLWRRRVKILEGQTRALEPVLVSTRKREGRVHVGLALVATGGALAIVGVACALASESAANEARDIARVETARDPTQPLSTTGAIEPVRTRADFERARTRATNWAIASDVSYGVALVAGAIGAYYLWRGERDRADVPPPFAIAPARGGAIVAKELRW
jgi:hypothetical protein